MANETEPVGKSQVAGPPSKDEEALVMEKVVLNGPTDVLKNGNGKVKPENGEVKHSLANGEEGEAGALPNTTASDSSPRSNDSTNGHGVSQDAEKSTTNQESLHVVTQAIKSNVVDPEMPEANVVKKEVPESDPEKSTTNHESLFVATQALESNVVDRELPEANVVKNEVPESDAVIHERELQPWEIMAEMRSIEQNGASTIEEEQSFATGSLVLPDTWKPDEQLARSVVLPPYLAKLITEAVTLKAVDAAPNTDSSPQQGSVEPHPHPIPTSPVLVFINSRSGGRLGPSLSNEFISLIGPAQVFDLYKLKPPVVLRSILGCLDRLAEAGDECAKGVRANLRILVAGGDGTVGWILSSIASLNLPMDKVPPVGIAPLGTGNDLARTFGWGATFGSPRPSRVRRHLLRIAAAEPTQLDSWNIIVRPSRGDFDPPIKFPHALQPQMHIPLPQAAAQEDAVVAGNAFHGSFWNYFSIGMDAKIAYGFHQLREEKPWMARSRMTNQMIYAGYTCSQGWFCTPCSYSPSTTGLATIAQVEVQKRPNGEWTHLELPPSVRALVLLNLQSYAGGRDPWGSPPSKVATEKGWGDATVDDGLMEVVGLKDGWHAALLMGKFLSHASRLAQVHAIKVEVGEEGGWRHAYMQMDGEPWRQPLSTAPDGPSTFVEISCNDIKSKVLMCRPNHNPSADEMSSVERTHAASASAPTDDR